VESLQLIEARGTGLSPWIDPLGELRIRVFREFPYLYEGSLGYEREYLQTYMRSPRSLVVLALDETRRVVGATTCLPLEDEGPEFQEPFLHAGWDIHDICYFGESILLPAHRGRGLGKEFFRRREAHADTLGLKWRAFCAVDRPDNHPLRPPAYRPLDTFWAVLGFEKKPGLQATFAWRETGESTASPKTLTFWTKHRP
jgi:GNAT superfamily N-acetyltransferase